MSLPLQGCCEGFSPKTKMPEIADKSPENGNSEDEMEFVIGFVKSNYFRVIHADGAWGSITPFGNIHMAFYSERAAIPDIGKLTVSTKTGEVSKPEEYEADSEIVREMEVDVVVDLGTAMRIRSWLDDKIKDLQSMVKQAKQQEKPK
jgi:hypothetical protein